MGEVAERSEVGEGLSVTCGDSSPRGRAEGESQGGERQAFDRPITIEYNAGMFKGFYRFANNFMKWAGLLFTALYFVSAFIVVYSKTD